MSDHITNLQSNLSKLKIHLDNKNTAIDWSLIKSIVCGAGQVLTSVCGTLPAGIPKDIICGLAAAANGACAIIPGLNPEEPKEK